METKTIRNVFRISWIVAGLFLGACLCYGAQPRYERGLYNVEGVDSMFYGYGTSCYEKYGTSDPQRYLQDLYGNLFPGTNPKPAVVVVTGEIIRDGAIGLTTLHSDVNPNYKAIGGGSPKITSMKVEVFNPGDWDTYFHESSHAFNASLRVHNGGYHLFDEGMAVMVNWIFNNGRLSDDALGMARLARTLPDPNSLRTYILSRFDKDPEGHDYPIAGYFMMQVHDLAGPSALKYLITVDRKKESPNAVYRQLLRYLEVGPQGRIEEDMFWKMLYVRLLDWSEVKIMKSSYHQK